MKTETTSSSLLRRVQDPDDLAAWDRFVELYTPLLYQCARSLGLQDGDARDLVQDILAALVTRLPTFEYDPGHSFRAWLKTIVVNRAKNFWRSEARRKKMNDQFGVEHQRRTEELFEEQEYRQFVISRLLSMIRHEFNETDWRAFELRSFEQLSPEQVAAKLNISINRVYLGKSRILKRLREESRELID